MKQFLNSKEFFSYLKNLCLIVDTIYIPNGFNLIFLALTCLPRLKLLNHFLYSINYYETKLQIMILSSIILIDMYSTGTSRRSRCKELSSQHLFVGYLTLQQEVGSRKVTFDYSMKRQL